MIPYAEVARMLQEIYLKVSQIAGHLLTGDAQEEEEIAGSSGGRGQDCFDERTEDLCNAA